MQRGRVEISSLFAVLTPRNDVRRGGFWFLKNRAAGGRCRVFVRPAALTKQKRRRKSLMSVVFYCLFVVSVINTEIGGWGFEGFGEILRIGVGVVENCV